MKNCVEMLTAALFVVAYDGKQPNVHQQVNGKTNRYPDTEMLFSNMKP